MENNADFANVHYTQKSIEFYLKTSDHQKP